MWRRMGISAGQKEGYNLMYLKSSQKSRKLKIVDQLTSNQVPLGLENPASPPTTVVSHNGALNARSSTRLKT